MPTAVNVVVAADTEESARAVSSDLRRCKLEPVVRFAGTEDDLERLVPEAELLIVHHPSTALDPRRVLETWSARPGAPPMLAYGASFAEEEVIELMRAGARDCLRAGDLARIAAAFERETGETVARPARGEAEPADRYRALIEEIPALTYVAWADERGSRAYVSPQLVSMTGYSPSEWLAEPEMWVQRLHPDDREQVLRHYHEACSTGGRFACEYRLLDREGRVVWWRDEGRVLPGPDGRARFVRGFVLDVSEQKLAEESLRRLRYYDQLTGLPNRALLQRRLGRALAECLQAKRPLAVLILALDRFREVTNALGHHNSELIVRDLALRLGDALGDTDRVARLRGDEFGVLLPDADATLAHQVGGRVLGALDRPFMVQRLPIEVSASVGIAVAPEHGTEAETLLRHADAAVQSARKIGGGASVLYSPECEPFDPGRLALLGELRRALEANELQLHYQPKVDLKMHTVVGAEALLRWPHAKRGFISPGEYIELAEQTGIIRPLTRWVLDRATEEARSWARAGKPLPVAVNVSRRSLHDGRLIDEVSDVLKAHDLPTSRLQIEVTESAVMNEPRRAEEVLRGLTSRGIAVSIDDFGTGYTSLGLLRNLRVAELKIDKSFVIGMAGEGGEDTAIVRSTADLAHNLGISVVAEGVEDQWTLDLLSTFGCDQAQGYHIGRPMTSGSFVDWVTASGWRMPES